MGCFLTKVGKIVVERIRLYGTPVCPGLPPLKAMLKRVGADYEYININGDETARQRVREINQGYESVPTLEFADGSTLTEPSAAEVRKKLESMGYHVPLSAMIAGSAGQIVIALAIIIALLRGFGVF
jgi:mycoredoxin